MKLEPRGKTGIDAVVAGYLGVDLTPGFGAARTPVPFSDLFRPGKLIETEGLHFSLGGAVANTGLAMKRFGQRVELMGCVGRDTLGELVMARLAQEGAAAGIRRTDRAGTAYGLVLAPPGADRLFLEDPGCNRMFSADDLDYDAVGRSRLFHFGYPPLMEALWTNRGAGLLTLLGRVRERGVAVSLDMTLPDPDSPSGHADWRAILDAALPLVDIFVPSLEELLFMIAPEQYARLLAAGGDDMISAITPALVAELAAWVLARGVNIVLIKAGHRGAYLRTGDLAALAAAAPALRLATAGGCPDGVWLKPLPVEPGRFQIACGAGDCAVAGFLSALLNGAGVREAGAYAMLAGRDNLYGQDALAGLRNWEQMTQSLTDGSV